MQHELLASLNIAKCGRAYRTFPVALCALVAVVTPCTPNSIPHIGRGVDDPRGARVSVTLSPYDSLTASGSLRSSKIKSILFPRTLQRPTGSNVVCPPWQRLRQRLRWERGNLQRCHRAPPRPSTTATVHLSSSSVAGACHARTRLMESGGRARLPLHRDGPHASENC